MDNQSPEITSGLRRDENGRLVKDIRNLAACFYIDENLRDLFHYNEFNASFEYSRNFTWPGHARGVVKGKRVEDDDIVFIQYYIAHNKAFEMPIDKIRNVLLEIADRKSYHPVKFYLSQLEWDHEARLDKWLIEGCGVEDTIYTRDVGRKWLTAAVTRIYEPGFKFDSVLVLEGEENIGKSTALRILGDPWFTDSISLIQKEQDIVCKMIGNWIIELAEMKGIRKQESEFIKSFISCQVDEQRLAYRRDPKKYYRQSIFAGTSNNMAYLLDPDGNRRFWPVWCNKIDAAWIRENKAQLIAEAKYIYEQGVYPNTHDGEKLFLTGEALEISKKQQKMRISTDEVLEEEIERYLVSKEETTMREIFLDCLKYQPKELANRSAMTIVGRILKKLNFEKKQRRARDGERFKYVRMMVVSQMEFNVEEEE